MSSRTNEPCITNKLDTKDKTNRMKEELILTVQKLHWDNIKQGYPYIEDDDNNDGYVFGIEYGLNFDLLEQQWFTSEKERDEEVDRMLFGGDYTEIKEPFKVNSSVTELLAQSLSEGGGFK